MAVERITPQSLCDLYAMLPVEETHTFCRLMGDISDADIPIIITSRLNTLEQFRYSKKFFQNLAGIVLPFLLREAIKLAKEMPQASIDQLEGILQEQIKQSWEQQTRAIKKLEQAQLKQQRDRKSDPETIRRNVKICDLRVQDKKLWSLARLAKEFRVTKRAISLILQGEPKWRQLAAQLSLTP
jgi:hypothetical protein